MCLSSEFGEDGVGRTGRGGVEITMVIFLRFGERVGDEGCGERGNVVHNRFEDDSRVGDASIARDQSVDAYRADWGSLRIENWTYTAGQASDRATDSYPDRF